MLDNAVIEILPIEQACGELGKHYRLDREEKEKAGGVLIPARRMFLSFPNDFNGGYDMRKMISPLFMLIVVFAMAANASAGEKYKSLRGGADIPAGSNPSVGMDWQPGDASIARTFEHQPPLIPHSVEDYSITTLQNDCLDCHGDEDSDAPKSYKTHYTDRDGKVTESVSSRWYFCNQCHVGQVDVKPLVKNTFQKN